MSASIERQGRALRITGCTDRLMWYAGRVGQVVPLVRIEPDCYLSLEPAGFVNMVYKRDAEIVGADCTNGHKAKGEKA